MSTPNVRVLTTNQTTANDENKLTVPSDFLPRYKKIADKISGSKLTVNGFLDKKIKNESHICDQVLEKSELILIGIS